MTKLNVSLPKSVREFVQRQVEAGRYGNADGYLRALVEQDRRRQAALSGLRKEIRRGLDDFEDGDYTTYESPQQLAEEVMARGRARLAQDAAQANGRRRRQAQ